MIHFLLRGGLSVESLRDGLVCVTQHLPRRLTRDRFVVRDACGNWLDDSSGRLVDAATLRAIKGSS